VEDVRQVLGVDAGPAVGHRDLRLPVVERDPDRDLAPAVLEGVLDDVADDSLEATRVRVEDYGVTGEHDFRVPAPGPDDRSNQPGDVHPCPLHALPTCIEAR